MIRLTTNKLNQELQGAHILESILLEVCEEECFLFHTVCPSASGKPHFYQISTQVSEKNSESKLLITYN